MAIIGKIRQRSWILVGFIAVALLIFIIEAALDKNNLFRGGNGKNSVGKIAGSTISSKEFSDAVSDYEEGLKYINPTLQLNDEFRGQIQEEVWNTFASDRLLGKAYSSFGLEVSQDEMGELLWGPQPHPYAQYFLRRVHDVQPDIVNAQTGQIDAAKVKEFIKNIDQFDKQNKSNFKDMLLHIEKMIETIQLKQKYSSLVTQSFYVPTFMAKEVVNSGRKAIVTALTVPYSSLPDKKYPVTDEEITAYINDHKAKFERPATRVVDIVSFDVLPSSDDTAQAIANVRKMREEYLASLPNDSAYIARNSQQQADVQYISKEELLQSKRNADTLFSLPVGTLTDIYKDGSYYLFTKIIDRKTAPDTVHAAQIVLSEGKGSDDEKKAANVLADSLINMIRTGAKNFGQIASESSIDPNSKTNGGDLGFFTRHQKLPEVVDNKVFFDMQPGQIAKVEAQNYLFIVMLMEAKSPHVLTKFADFGVELIRGQETEKNIYSNASAFLQKNQDPAQFEKAAASQNLFKDIVLSQNMVDVPQIGPARKVVQWAFQQDKANVISTDLFDADTKYLAVKLKKVTDKGLPKAEDVREEVSLLVRNEKKGKDLVQQLNNAAGSNPDVHAIASKVTGATVTDTVIVHFSDPFVKDMGVEPKFIGTSFAVPVGKTSKAVAGQRAAFIIQPRFVEDKSPELGNDVTMFKPQIEKMYTKDLNFQSIFDAIMKKADVLDTRYKFY